MSERRTTSSASGSRAIQTCGASFSLMIGRDIHSARIMWCKSFITIYGCRSRTSTQTVAPMSLAHQVRGRNRDLCPEGVFYQCVRGDLDGAGGDALDVLAPVYPLRHIAVPR